MRREVRCERVKESAENALRNVGGRSGFFTFLDSTILDGDTILYSNTGVVVRWAEQNFAVGGFDGWSWRSDTRNEAGAVGVFGCHFTCGGMRREQAAGYARCG